MTAGPKVILGDTNSCLAAIAAKRRRIPIYHMQAGNRCFDDRVPEKIHRRIIDQPVRYFRRGYGSSAWRRPSRSGWA